MIFIYPNAYDYSWILFKDLSLFMDRKEQFWWSVCRGAVNWTEQRLMRFHVGNSTLINIAKENAAPQNPMKFLFKMSTVYFWKQSYLKWRNIDLLCNQLKHFLIQF